MSLLRIAPVDYLNARPLARGFTHGPERDRFQVSASSPARCAERLRSGEVDVALIPSIEYQRLPGLRIVPGIAIASRREARSVILASKVAAPEIRSVALDASSRTSAALVRILLARRSRHRVEYREANPELRTMLGSCDAALLIGDPALKAKLDGLRVYDLAGEWQAMTGLPFVFAFWALRPGVVLPDGSHPFLASRRLGLASLDAIAAEESTALGLPADSLSDYFIRNIHYDLGPEESRSLWLFYRLSREAGLIPTAREIAFGEAAGDAREWAGAGGTP